MLTSLQDIDIEDIAGRATSLGEYRGKVLLVVNVASQCGLTPQYEALERVYTDYRDRGFCVLGFPANDFGAQEPGSNDEIAQFCSANFGVDFPMFAKIVVSGPNKHPLYASLTAAVPAKLGDPEAFRARLRGFGLLPTEDPEVLWNFEKFLISRDGRVVARFAPDMAPDDPAIIAGIEAQLGDGAAGV
jgi:glutathione peroxidase